MNEEEAEKIETTRRGALKAIISMMIPCRYYGEEGSSYEDLLGELQEDDALTLAIVKEFDEEELRKAFKLGEKFDRSCEEELAVLQVAPFLEESELSRIWVVLNAREELKQVAKELEQSDITKSGQVQILQERVLWKLRVGSLEEYKAWNTEDPIKDRIEEMGEPWTSMAKMMMEEIDDWAFQKFTPSAETRARSAWRITRAPAQACPEPNPGYDDSRLGLGRLKAIVQAMIPAMYEGESETSTEEQFERMLAVSDGLTIAIAKELAGEELARAWRWAKDGEGQGAIVSNIVLSPVYQRLTEAEQIAADASSFVDNEYVEAGTVAIGMGALRKGEELSDGERMQLWKEIFISRVEMYAGGKDGVRVGWERGSEHSPEKWVTERAEALPEPWRRHAIRNLAKMEEELGMRIGWERKHGKNDL